VNCEKKKGCRLFHWTGEGGGGGGGGEGNRSKVN